MLDVLHIENIAVIEQADIEFGPGLNVLSGETGAGKSIVIDAIGAILGERVSRELVRTGAAAARVTAELSLSPAIVGWLEAADIPWEPGDEVVITRRIGADGKSVCRINGCPVGTVQLRELGELLFDVHGQNEGRHLLNESSHRRYLDEYGGLESRAAAFGEAFAAYRELRERAEALSRSEADKELLEARLEREIRELRDAEPQDGEEEALEERVKLLKNAEKLTDKLNRAYECMYGGDEGEGALSLIAAAENAVESAARIAETIGDLARNMGDFRYRAEDMAEQIESALRELDYTPGELDRLEGRLSVLRRLSRRYGSAEAARQRLEEAENELEDVQYLSERLAKMEQELDTRREGLLELAAALTRDRQEAAERLSEAVMAELRDLSMPGARFQVEFRPKGGDGFDAGGGESVRFLLAANAGEKPGRLSHIASGGELSRIMLAMKNVLRAASDPEVLIFDEIDTGVSGIAAQRVGEKLSELSMERQVLCITHLPQLAAAADTQFSIVKETREGRTYTRVTKLDDNGRIRELARLIGGERVTDTTLKSAEELIQAAQAYKNRRRNG